MTDIRYTVMLHGFTREYDASGNVMSQDHCDFDSPDCDGWNVWLRRDWSSPNEHHEVFDSDDDWDADFNSLEAAQTYAVALQQLFDCELDEY